MRRLFLLIAATALLWPVTAPPASSQFKPRLFRSLADVGAFAGNGVGRWDAAAKRFQGSGVLATADSPFTGSTYGPIPVTELRHVSIDTNPSEATNNYSALSVHVTASGAQLFRGTQSEVQGGDGVLSLTAGRGNAFFTGSGTLLNLTGWAGVAQPDSGTATNAFGLLGNAGTQAGTTASVTNASGVRGVAYAQAAGMGSAVTTGAGFYGFINVTTGGVMTNAYGLRLTDWSNAGTVTNSAGIYADTSIDLGTTRHFILSTSTSTSALAGDVAITDSAKGVVLKAPGGHYFRLAVSDGGAVSTSDLGTGAP